jgi:type I restriction enzyme S subunit
MSWEKVKLGDIATFSNGINFGKDAYSSGVKLITVSDFGNLYYPDYASLNEVDEKVLRKNDYLKDGDIVFVRSNGNKELVGRCMLISNPPAPVTYSGFCIRARLNDTQLNDPHFFAYYFKSQIFRKAMSNSAVGANIQNLNQGLLSNHILSLPSLKEQKRIADILSAYDDLIENNQKQIKLLEEAAQRLYKQWFIDLRFPGHETTKIVDGLPEGWRKEKLVDLASVQFGYAFDGSLFNSNGNGTPIVRIRNIPDGFTNDYTTENAPEEYIINNGDIVVGMDGEFHINSWSGETSYLVQRSCCFKPRNPKMKGWLLWAIHDPIKFFEKTVVGATVAHLGKKHIDTIELLTGPEKLYEPFQNLFCKRQTLLNQNRKLAESRDRLLPKLMNGELEI